MQVRDERVEGVCRDKSKSFWHIGGSHYRKPLVGTTRSRVSSFMNRFRKLGFINYDVGDNLRVHSSLLNVVLQDDDGVTMTPGAKNPTARTVKRPEPPAERGGPPDKERAKRPRLRGVAQRLN